MVGIVIVSHSAKVAEGVVELAAIMAPNTPMRAAGGLEDGGFGTSYEKILDAINEIYTDDGVVVLMDIGSSVMVTRSVIEDINEESERLIKMVDCPLVEGAIVAAVTSSCGDDIDAVIEEAESVGRTPKLSRH